MTPQELKQKRKNLALTQKELGNVMGYSQMQISAMENGAVNISQKFTSHLNAIIKNETSNKIISAVKEIIKIKPKDD